jgi:hypothetical protein
MLSCVCACHEDIWEGGQLQAPAAVHLEIDLFVPNAWEVVWMFGEEKHLLSLPRNERKFLRCPATSPGCCTKYAGLV